MEWLKIAGLGCERPGPRGHFEAGVGCSEVGALFVLVTVDNGAVTALQRFGWYSYSV